MRLTPRLGREMRLTIIILRIFAPANTNNGRLYINSEIHSITYHLSIIDTWPKFLEAKMRLTYLLHYNFSVRLLYFWTITVIIVKLTEYVL